MESVRGVRVGTGANCDEFVGTRPVEREFGLEDRGVRVSLRALADGGRPIAHPRSADNGGFEERTQCAG